MLKFCSVPRNNQFGINEINIHTCIIFCILLLLRIIIINQTNCSLMNEIGKLLIDCCIKGLCSYIKYTFYGLRQVLKSICILHMYICWNKLSIDLIIVHDHGHYSKNKSKVRRCIHQNFRSRISQCALIIRHVARCMIFDTLTQHTFVASPTMHFAVLLRCTLTDVGS